MQSTRNPRRPGQVSSIPQPLRSTGKSKAAQAFATWCELGLCRHKAELTLRAERGQSVGLSKVALVSIHERKEAAEVLSPHL